MPVFYQHDINGSTKLGVWHIQEQEDFFLAKVPLQREITHPHKRLQHLAGRYLLQYLFPDFPYELIQIADTRKPFLINEAYHFSISHCGNYAAALVSSNQRVGVDIEISTPKIARILHKFLNEDEKHFLFTYNYHDADDLKMPPGPQHNAIYRLPTLLWSAKEAVFKWHGNGGVDFSEHIRLQPFKFGNEGNINCAFTKFRNTGLMLDYRLFSDLCLCTVVTEIHI